jgi:DNA replication protein DnaC
MTAQQLEQLLRELRWPVAAERHQQVSLQAEREGLSFTQYLRALAEQEVEGKRQRRVERLLKASGLPPDKTRATLQLDRVAPKARRQITRAFEGDFVDAAENLLLFGLPGRGKTHAACAIGHELVRAGWSVLFLPAYQLVQRLLAAKRELRLEKVIAQLDSMDVVIVDDLGYVQQDRSEMEVLFTFLAERYERRSVIITSNLVFSQWERIFHDPMTTAAAIDRLVHHATIIEMLGESVRAGEAATRKAAETTEVAP